MAPSFEDILSKSTAHIEKPKPLPVGTYRCIVEYFEFTIAGVNNTPCVDFYLNPLQAGSDVDSGQLAKVLNGTALSNRKIRHRMFVTDDSAWRLKEFLLEDLEVPPMTLREMIFEATGKQVMVTLAHQTSHDGTQTFQVVKRTARVNS